MTKCFKFYCNHLKLFNNSADTWFFSRSKCINKIIEIRTLCTFVLWSVFVRDLLLMRWRRFKRRNLNILENLENFLPLEVFIDFPPENMQTINNVHRIWDFSFNIQFFLLYLNQINNLFSPFFSSKCFFFIWRLDTCFECNYQDKQTNKNKIFI